MSRLATQKPAAAPTITTTVQMPPQEAAEKTEDSRPDFFSYMQSLTPEQWKRHIVYITREQPKTSINGVGGYLTKLQQAFDIEDIKLAFGGQEFSYIMKRDNDIIYSGKFRIEAPPRYDSTRESAAGTPTNGHSDGTAQLLQQFVGVLRDELARSREDGKGSGVTEEAIKLLTSASDHAMSVITKQVPQASDPTAQLTALLAAAEKIAAMRAPAPAASGLGELGTILVPILKTLAEKLLTPTDPLDQITKLAGIFDVLEKLRGPGGGKSDYRTALVEQGIPAVRDLITTIAERRASDVEIARQARARAESQERTANTAKELNAQRLAAANQRPAPQAAAPSAAPAADLPLRSGRGVGAAPFRVVPMNGEPVESAPAPAETPRVQVNADEYLNGVKLRFVELLSSDEDSEYIVDYLEASGLDLVAHLTKFSPAQISTYCQSDFILAHAVALPRWAEWLEDARAYLTAVPEEVPERVM
jgi:hypothetical protein